MSESFPRLLKMLRKEQKLSQREAAELLGVSQALLSHYEKGIRECKLDFVVKVADFYGVSCDYLLGRSPEKNGANITVEDIPDPETIRDKTLKTSILTTLNKKLLSNSINILYDFLAKCNNKHLTSEVSAYLSVAFYKMFRAVYSSNPKNPGEIFAVPDKLEQGLTSSAMSIAESNVKMLASGQSYGTLEGLENTEILDESSESIAKEYPLYSASLSNVIKTAEQRMGFSGK
ncbi:MAG: helix-turn-helix domain-containing protein [Clostridia bacterium]|nr:helix-turn-helix domain-containing protein [Clostridia bacterium]